MNYTDLDISKILRMYDAGQNITEIAKEFDVVRGTIQYHLKKHSRSLGRGYLQSGRDICHHCGQKYWLKEA